MVWKILFVVLVVYGLRFVERNVAPVKALETALGVAA